MGRMKHYARSLTSSYALLAANVAYTVASVPLALRYLSKDEFGLWALTSQITGYIALLDFGMSGAAMRILIDFKDRKEDRAYGSTILTGMLVNFVQSVLVTLCGLGIAFLLGPLLQIPPALSGHFTWLMVGQAGLAGANLALRMGFMILSAHQRVDLVNWSQTVFFGVGFGILWWGFAMGLGVYSMLWALAASQVLSVVVGIAACLHLRLLPRRGQWGRPSWQRFWDLFAFGRDMLLYSIGHLLVNASQTILVARMADLPTAAIWSICTRVFGLVTQVVFRIFDSACAPLAEMIVRQEHARLLMRFRSMVVVSCSLSVVAGLGLAVGNQPFVAWWTSGRIAWPVCNDWLLALWLPILVVVRSHTGLVGLTKDFRFMRWLLFLEGLFFISIAVLVLPFGGLTAMLGTSILGSLIFSFPYSLRRTSEYFGVGLRTVGWNWMQPAVSLAALLIPVTAAVAWFTQSLNAPMRLLIGSGIIGGVGGVLLLRTGMDDMMRQELGARLPAKLSWIRVLWKKPAKSRT